MMRLRLFSQVSWSPSTSDSRSPGQRLSQIK